MILISLFKKFFIELIIGLMKDLVGYLNLLLENVSIFLFTVYYQQVHALNCLTN